MSFIKKGQKTAYSTTSNILDNIEAKGRHLKYKLKYGSSFRDPGDIIYINPNKVKHVILSSDLRKPGTFIIGGDWDKKRKQNIDKIPCYSDKEKYNELIERTPWNLYRFEKFGHYKSYVQHFEYGVPWQKTEFYQNLISNNGENSPKYTNTKDKILNRLNYDEHLFKSIKENGYRTQEDIQRQNKTTYKKDSEVGVGITREGEIVFVRNGAIHRFTMAKILNLQTIPAKVKLRHKEWQKVRQDICQEGIMDDHCEKIRNHPDLQDMQTQ